jgi:hypothetical protein
LLKTSEVKTLKKMSKKIMNKLVGKISRSIYIKLISWTICSIILCGLVGFLIAEVLKPVRAVNQIHVDYSKDRNDSDKRILNFIREAYEHKGNEKEYIEGSIQDFSGSAYLVDEKGEVVYRNNSDTNFISKIDIEKLKEKIG